MTALGEFFKLMRERGASDLHLCAGAPPICRRYGEMETIEQQKLTDDAIRRLVFELLTPEQRAVFEREHELDFSYEVPGVARLRANVFEQRNGVGAAFRILPTEIIPFDTLGLPDAVLKLTEAERGLVVVTGPPGSGKTTTLAALVDHINRTQRKHIITIEDPIEYHHSNKSCLVNQREVGRTTRSFAGALRSALREDPDVILVGEMRDLETMGLAITAAETGQTVYATLHTTSAAQTVERMVDAFPVNQQQQIRTMLAGSLQGVIAQRLLKRADGSGRIAAAELLFRTPAVAAMIRDNKTFQLTSVLQTGKREGMQSMDDSLMNLLLNGIIAADEAVRYATSKDTVEAYATHMAGAPAAGSR
jgi:twitching motility protein PilT